MNLNDDPRGGTFCHSSAGLAIGDGAKTGPAIVGKDSMGVKYSIDGIMYYIDDAATVKPLTADTVQPVLTKCLYLICVDSSQAVTSVQGRPALTADLVNGTDVLEWPEPTADTCPIGAVKVETQLTATFTPGTTALDASNIVETYYDLFSLPTTPLTA